MTDAPKPTFEEIVALIMENVERLTELAEEGYPEFALEHMKLAGDLLEALGYEPDWPKGAKDA